MSELLLLQDRVRNTIQLGESHFREFKSAIEGPPNNKKPRPTTAICRDIAEALVAFANADGGELLIGVEDDGLISGVPHADEDVEKMFHALDGRIPPDSSLPSLLVTSTKLQLENKTVIFFSILKGTTEIYCLTDGRYVRRQDKSTVPLSIRQHLFERQEVRSREFDRQFVDGATVNDLDLALVQSLANSYVQGFSIELYLQQIGLAEFGAGGLRLRMAATLLFAKDILRWHPRSQVRIIKVLGTELKSGESYNVQSDTVVKGNVFQLLIDSWERLRSFLAVKTDFGPDAKFEQKYIYPEWACREALINAIAHRDYSIQNAIEIFIFDDRMEIKSPGALLSTLTLEGLEELQGAHESRNVLIAKVLRENKYMRELGEGIKRMFELMKENELELPKLYSNHNWFSVTLPHKSVFNEKQEAFLTLFSPINLTPRQKKIVVLGMDNREISPNDIYKAINTRDRNIYDGEVTGLRKTGVLEQIRTNPEAKSYENHNRLMRGDAPRFKVKLPSTKTGNFPKQVRRQGVGRKHKGSPGFNVGRPPASVTNAPAMPVSQASSSRKYGISIKNLPASINERELREAFEKYGNIVGVYLPIKNVRPGTGRSGTVWFESSESVIAAIQGLNGADLRGNRIIVEEYQHPS